jgi:hypothetical protein
VRSVTKHSAKKCSKWVRERIARFKESWEEATEKGSGIFEEPLRF